MGNICRSPTAKGIFDAHFARIGLTVETASAGTHGYHVGEAPDPRAVAAAARRDVDISRDVARRIESRDFDHFDRIFVMDRQNMALVEQMRPDDGTAEVALLMSLAPDYGLDEVPDPYYGGEAGFSRVLDMLDAAAEALVRELSAGTHTPAD